ncbi:MAG: RNA polymerase sigma factor [Firmicutes bacterium]|nr:RNA polymerase sigma factor [Bacillota bacterium]
MKEKMKYSSPKVSDRLIKKIANHDADSFETLYQLSSSAVFGLAYSIVGNQVDAEDVVQDVYLSIYEKAHQYKGGGKAMAWIFTITRNQALMMIRDRNKRQHVNLDEVYDVGIDHKIEDKVYNDKLIKVILETLNEDERQIVIMHSMSNIKHKEIADLLEMPLSTVLSKYNRALKKLKKELVVNGYEK